MKIHKTVLHDGDDRTMNVWAAADHTESQRREDIDFWRAAARRRAANGEPGTAVLFNNLAWLLEYGITWEQFVRQDGKTDDAEVKP